MDTRFGHSASSLFQPSRTGMTVAKFASRSREYVPLNPSAWHQLSTRSIQRFITGQ